MQLSLSFVKLETTDLRGRKEGGGEFTHTLVLRNFESETIDLRSIILFYYGMTPNVL